MIPVKNKNSVVDNVSISKAIYSFLLRQVFIGHSDHIQQVSFTPDYLGLVTVGEAILLWDFHGRGRLLQING